MAEYNLSTRAALDLEEIYEYSIASFGLAQARNYLLGLDELLDALAENPTRGRSASELAPGLHRLAYHAHIVFYRPETDGVHIVRILHQSMDFQRHL